MFLTKSIPKPYGRETAMPTAGELNRFLRLPSELLRQTFSDREKGITIVGIGLAQHGTTAQYPNH